MEQWKNNGILDKVFFSPPFTHVLRANKILISFKIMPNQFEKVGIDDAHNQSASFSLNACFKHRWIILIMFPINTEYRIKAAFKRN